MEENALEQEKHDEEIEATAAEESMDSVDEAGRRSDSREIHEEQVEAAADASGDDEVDSIEAFEEASLELSEEEMDEEEDTVLEADETAEAPELDLSAEEEEEFEASGIEEDTFGEAVAEEEAMELQEASEENEDVDVIRAEADVTNVANVISEAEVIEHQAEAAAEIISGALGATAAEENAPFSKIEHDPGINDEEEEAAPALKPEMLELMPFRELQGDSLQAAVEATFFMHHKPISISRLRDLINPKIKEDEYRTAVSNLMASYWDDNRGIELAEVAGGYQFRTKEIHKDIMRRMYQIAPMKLTNAMLEVLAISAYNQPVTREGIDQVRGVDSSHLVRVLLDKKMLRIVGKSDELGRPMLYGTTKEFLEVFGLRDLSALPTLRELEDMLPKNEVGAEISEEEMLARDMEGIVENSKPLEFNDLELEDLEYNETQKVQRSEAAAPEAHGNRSETQDGSSEAGLEAGGDLHLPDETPGREPSGQEGHA
jgi:segregation and condensation protein B